MENLYVVTTGFDYEGESLNGLFSSYEKAKKYVDNLVNDPETEADTVNIYLTEVDYDYDDTPTCLWYQRVKSKKVLVGNDK